MRCHYEVLEIPRDAEEAVIKVAYKKMALRWHPDKNLDRPEEAKVQFQLVQQAYEILTDKQERAWYDSHREQILRSADTSSSTKDNVHLFDVFPYFSSTCFCGYGDDEKGFYAVYRQVFNKIATEDLSEVDLEDKDDFLSIPVFGDFTSDYEEVVHPFYSYWIAYNTRTTYSWLDERIPKDIRDRRVFKLVEKENKKIRAKAKRERNEEVRSLVAFVRKRDKRVHANVKRLQERAQENRKKQEKISRDRRIESRRSNMAAEQAEWTKFDNVKAQLEEIERYLGGSSDDSSHDGDEDGIRDDDPLLCVACNKLFKTQNAFENHEKSKKHKESVEILKDMLQKEDLLQSESNCVSSEENCDIIPTKSNKNSRKQKNDEVLLNVELNSDDTHRTSDNLSEIDDLSSIDDEEHSDKSSKKARKKRKSNKKVLLTVDDADVVEDHLDDINSNNLDKSASVKTQDDESVSSPSRQASKIKKKRRKDRKGSDNGGGNIPRDTKDSSRPKQAVVQMSNGADSDRLPINVCVLCKNTFPSNNKLFAHLKKSGHAQPLP